MLSSKILAGRRTVRALTARGSVASGRVVEREMLRNCVLICAFLNPNFFCFWKKPRAF